MCPSDQNYGILYTELCVLRTFGGGD
eukprot:COSAG02_NODE_2968_length_7640_cov_10.957831_1_plen_25_part_10